MTEAMQSKITRTTKLLFQCIFIANLLGGQEDVRGSSPGKKIANKDWTGPRGWVEPAVRTLDKRLLHPARRGVNREPGSLRLKLRCTSETVWGRKAETLKAN